MVAEGVEDEATLAALAELGADQAQGFCIAQPMTLDELVGWTPAYGLDGLDGLEALDLHEPQDRQDRV